MSPMFSAGRRCALATLLVLSACTGGSTTEQTPTPPEAPALVTDHGVDVASKTIKVGTLNDESGPGAAIGKPYAVGKRVLAAAINAGGTGLLPDGWKIELVERDHGYNPQNAVQAYNELQEGVLFIGTSFSTPTTLPLRPMLERDNVVAFPASLSSAMAENAFTPPLGPSYELEAMRMMDWVVESAGGADKVKAGIVYQQDDYGGDGLKGWKAAASYYDIAIVSEQTVSPGQKDFAAVVTGLKDAGATHILVTTLPSTTGPLLGTAAQLQYMPVWVGSTPAWIDKFYDASVIPSAVFTNYYQASGLPFWGEPVPGMDRFLAAYEAHGKELSAPDSYILLSYIQGLSQVEAAKRAIERGDISRAGYRKAMTSIDGFTADGIIQPISLTTLPYVTGTRTRVLKPDFENRTWTVVADYADPKARNGGKATDAPAGEAPAGEATPSGPSGPGTGAPAKLHYPKGLPVKKPGMPGPGPGAKPAESPSGGAQQGGAKK